MPSLTSCPLAGPAARALWRLLLSIRFPPRHTAGSVGRAEGSWEKRQLKSPQEHSRRQGLGPRGSLGW